jgi:hypothetical protein
MFQELHVLGGTDNLTKSMLSSLPFVCCTASMTRLLLGVLPCHCLLSGCDTYLQSQLSLSSSLHVALEIPALDVSLVDGRPQELLLLSMDGLVAEYHAGNSAGTAYTQASRQLDVTPSKHESAGTYVGSGATCTMLCKLAATGSAVLSTIKEDLVGSTIGSQHPPAAAHNRHSPGKCLTLTSVTITC